MLAYDNIPLLIWIDLLLSWNTVLGKYLDSAYEFTSGLKISYSVAIKLNMFSSKLLNMIISYTKLK